MDASFKNILIIKPSSLGDVVLALPALSALRKSFPDAKISWLVRPEFAPVLENHPDLDEIIIFDRKLLGKFFCPAGFKAILSLIKKLRSEKFDAVFDFQGLFRTAGLAWLSGCKNRFGMANARECASSFYSCKVPQDNQSIHLVDLYLKIVRAAGAANTEPHFTLPVDPAAEKSVKDLLDTHKVKPGSYAVLITTSAREGKCWPIENFAAVAEKLYSQFQLPSIATGLASEKDYIDKFSHFSKTPVINLAGSLSLKELIALLASAKIVLSNDTGPGHIAAALGTPVVMIFGYSNPARVAPYKKPNSFVAIDDGSRGEQTNNFDPKYDVKNVTVDMTFEKLRLFL
jgi:lipopolysaccharide heptosyltransferase I